MNKTLCNVRELIHILARTLCFFILIVTQLAPVLIQAEDKQEQKEVVVPGVTDEDAQKFEKLRALVRERTKQAVEEREKKAQEEAEKAAKAAEEEFEKAAKAEAIEAARREPQDQPEKKEEEPDPTELQAMEYFRRFSRGEVYLIYKCCQLTPEQIQQLNDAGEHEIRRLFKQRRGQNPAEAQLRENGIVRILPNGRRVNNIPLDTRSSIRLAISKSADSILPAEKLASYKSEVEKRDLSRKRASIQMIVARIDRDLSFTTEQREKLTEVLIKSLNSTEYNAPEEIMLSNQQQIPPLPPKLIEPLLTESQKTAWRRLPKSRNQYNFDEMMMNNGGNLPGLSDEDIQGLKGEKPIDPQSKPQEGEVTK